MLTDELHWQGVASFLMIFVGYTISNTLLQYLYYAREKSIEENNKDQSTITWDWKIQKNQTVSLGDKSWWLPILANKKRGPYHWLFATVNLTVASCFAGAIAELAVRGRGNLYYNIGDYGWSYFIFISTLLPYLWQGVLEYYWHRLMHWPFFYKHFHKIHHYNKSPEPFDDMYVHPLEVIGTSIHCHSFLTFSKGYYFILYSPAWAPIFPVHIISFFLYMIVHGITGILDHSGIHFTFPGFYDTVDHDTHHLKFECNYSFPFPWMDILHGTYRGVYLGKTYFYSKLKGK